MRYEFAGFSFDTERGLQGPVGSMSLRRRDARLLQLLLEADGRTVTKDEILATVWLNRDVTEDSITQAVRRLRAHLPGDPGAEIVQTVYGRGLRLGVRVLQAGCTPAATGTASVARPRVQALQSLTSARELAARRGASDIAAAVDAARLAITLQPAMADAWATLADLHVLQAGRMIVPPREAGALALQAANRALEIDPACASALASRGWVRAVILLDVGGGLDDFQASLQVSDAHWFARGLHGWALVAAGRPSDALAEMRVASELNPWAGWSSGVHAQYLYFSGDSDGALAEAREAVRRFPNLEISQQQLAMIASGVGLHDEAIEAGRRAKDLAPDTLLVHSALAGALARSGRRSEAHEEIRLLVESSPFPVASTWLASAWLDLGERKEALRQLALARETGAPQFVLAFVDPRLAPLHGDPEFERLRPQTG